MNAWDQKENTFEIAVFSQNASFKEAFQSIEQVSLVIQLPKAEPNIRCKAVFIDGETVSYRDLNDCRSMYPDIPIFFRMYGITNQAYMKNIQTICKALEIEPIREYLTVEQVIQVITSKLFESQSQVTNRIVSFFGTHSGAGVSTTVLNVAKVLAGKVEEKVLVLSLNPWDMSDYFLNYKGKYLNDVKVDLKTGSLTEQKLMDAVCKYKGFYHLAGNRDIKLQRFYQTEEIAELIKVAQACFDIILIDAGPHFDNANYAQAYIQSELKFLVTDQTEKGYRGYWPYIFTQLLEPIGATANEFILLLNHFKPDPALISEKDIQAELDMTLLTTIPDIGTLGSIGIRQKQLLYDLADETYRGSIETIAHSIQGRANLTIKKSVLDEMNKKKGFLQRLFGKKDSDDDWYDEAL